MAKAAATMKEKAFLKAVTNLDAEIVKPDAKLAAVTSLAKIVNMKAEAYVESLKTLGDEFIQANKEDKFLEVEEKLSQLTIKVDAADAKAYEFIAQNSPAATATSPPPPPPDSKLHLPQLKLMQFTGDVRKWLQFWAGFAEIHGNASMSDTEKFQYLIQCLPEGTAARSCIDSFPVCGNNYKSAITALESTFGRPKMLVKVYVRDLLQLVIKNATQKSSINLLELVPQLSSKIRNLEALKVTSDKCEDILYPLVESCLPEEVLQAWQRSPNHQEKLKDILSFLDGEVQQQMERSLAKMEFSTTTTVKAVQPKKDKQPELPTASALMNLGGGNRRNNKGCCFCEGARHSSKNCFQARKMTIKEKEEILRKKQLCFKCLKPGHMVADCIVLAVCGNCKGQHFDVMCRNQAQQEQPRQQVPVTPPPSQKNSGFMAQPTGNCLCFGGNQQQPPPPQRRPMPTPFQWNDIMERKQNPSGSVTSTDMSNLNTKRDIRMMSMVVEVDTISGPCLARVFFDDGSSESYIDEMTARFVKHTKLGSQTIQHEVFGGVVTPAQQHDQLLITVKNIDDNTKTGTFIFNTIPQIANRIRKPDQSLVAKLEGKGIKLHDQSAFNEEVHMLFGLDILTQIWTGGFMRISEHITAHETIFGWVAGGTQQQSKVADATQSHMVTSFMLGKLSEEELWSLEALGITEESRTQTKEDMERAAVEHFRSTVTREEDGRYKVCLPWIQGHRDLQSNKDQALARLNSLTRRLKKDGYLENYDTIFKQWITDGITEMVAPAQLSSMDYYLPHRHVVKPGSTTPVRPVFDASAKGKGSVSLNDCLEKGPNMLERIPALLTQFRMNRVGAIADIKKAFLQMSVAEQDRKALQFLWWKDTTCKEIVVQRHARVVFGVTSSPFLLAITLHHHISQNASRYPEIADKLFETLYVDNVVTSFTSEEEAVKFQQQSHKLLMEAQFDLRGWEFGPSSDEKSLPVLGMVWNLKADVLKLAMDGVLEKMELSATKRGLLAAVNSIFDPLGIVSPFTLVSKLLFQKACEANLGWDDDLPPEILEDFVKWKAQVPLLRQVAVRRWLCPSSSSAKYSLHTFSDASGYAFSCCTFLRAEENENVSVQLIMSKGRVAPSKIKMTMPRMELTGCLIGIRLCKEIRRYIGKDDIPCHYWTDSSTALAWITHDKPWARFVDARVNEIRRLSKPEEWNHVPGTCNPADLPSRGCSATQLLQVQWWEGPGWLKSPPGFWPSSKVTVNEEEVCKELKKTVVSSHVQPRVDVLDKLMNYSSFNVSLRVAGYVLKYVKCLRERITARKGGKVLLLQRQQLKLLPLTAEEIRRAEVIVIRYIQRSGFEGEGDPRLKSMSTFVDEDGIIRVRSQLFFGEDEFGVRCPAVLPNKHPVVHAIIRSFHLRHNHVGVQTLMTQLRETFWIIKARRTISSVVNSCGTCRRFTAKRCDAPSAPLPKKRIEDGAAFTTTGVDLLGPLFLRGGEKIWVVLFTCAVYRCVHLEVTSTLSTEGFIRAFRRFVSRRGRPSTIFSDNGLNFVGCFNLFQRVNWTEVQRIAAVEKVEWIFNPPTAAWWGGFWERLVGLTKNLLRRVLGKKVVNLEEFTTILCDVEASLNQRPLGYLSDSLVELVPLCPNYFLKAIIPGSLPEADVVDITTINECAKRVQKVREELRTRFRKEYLGQLKHKAGTKDLAVAPGDVVIVEVDDRKRLDWPLGLVKEVYPGRDGKVRTALVKVRNGEVLRPIQRLFLLETAHSNTEGGSSTDVEDLPLEESVEAVQDKPEEVVEAVPKSRAGRILRKPERLIL